MKVISYQNLFGHNQPIHTFLLPYTIKHDDKYYLPHNFVKSFGYCYMREWIEVIDI